MSLVGSACPRALFTSPVGRGRRAAPGEGLRSRVLEQRPLTRFAAQIDLSPMGRGGPVARTDRFNPNSYRSNLADLPGLPAEHHGAPLPVVEGAGGAPAAPSVSALASAGPPGGAIPGQNPSALTRSSAITGLLGDSGGASMFRMNSLPVRENHSASFDSRSD